MKLRAVGVLRSTISLEQLAKIRKLRGGGSGDRKFRSGKSGIGGSLVSKEVSITVNSAKGKKTKMIL